MIDLFIMLCEIMSGKERGYHLVIGGFEYDRLIGPMMGKYPVKKVIILKGKTKDAYPEAMDLTEHYMEKLSNNPIEIETVDTDIYNFDDVFLKTLDVIEKYAEKDDPIYLNISSAPKLALVGMISAAFMSKSNVEIFYVAPEKYLLPELLERFKDLDFEDESSIQKLRDTRDRFMEKGSGQGIKKYEEIPTFPIQDITEIDDSILSILEKRGGADSIKELHEKLNEDREKEVERSSLQYRIDKLKDIGLIKTERENRRLKIDLTRLGEIYEKGC